MKIQTLKIRVSAATSGKKNLQSVLQCHDHKWKNKFYYDPWTYQGSFVIDAN